MLSLFFSFGSENYITLKSDWQTRAESAWQVPKVLRNIPESFRRQVPCWRRRRGLGAAAPADARVPRESESASELPWVRGPSGSPSTFLPTTLPTSRLPIATAAAAAAALPNGGCLPACLLTCLPVTDSKTYGGCNANRDIVRAPDITRRALLYSYRID